MEDEARLKEAVVNMPLPGRLTPACAEHIEAGLTAQKSSASAFVNFEGALSVFHRTALDHRIAAGVHSGIACQLQ